MVPNKIVSDFFIRPPWGDNSRAWCEKADKKCQEYFEKSVFHIPVAPSKEMWLDITSFCQGLPRPIRDVLLDMPVRGIENVVLHSQYVEIRIDF